MLSAMNQFVDAKRIISTLTPELETTPDGSGRIAASAIPEGGDGVGGKKPGEQDQASAHLPVLEVLEHFRQSTGKGLVQSFLQVVIRTLKTQGRLSFSCTKLRA